MATLNIVTNEGTNENMRCCDCCERLIEGEGIFVYYRNNIHQTICENCASDTDSYVETTEEGHYIEVDDAVYAYDTGDICEEYNASTYFYQCDRCHDYYADSDNVRQDDNGNCICDNCYETYDYCYCDDCGRLVCGYDGECHYSERDDRYYCDDCYEDHCDNFIEEYGHNNNQYDLTFYSCDGEDTNEYFGVELEVDHGNCNDECAEEINSTVNQVMYFKRDGSLDDGFEIVSSPMTLRYHLEKGQWDSITAIARNHGYRSHDTSTCGLHVHVSRKSFGATPEEQDLHIAILMMLEYRFADKFHTFARRNACHWCSDNIIDIKKTDNFKTIKSKVDKFKDDRYYQINVQNKATVEFRCFRGTLKYETLIATIQFVATMARYCQQITIADVDRVQWEDIFQNTEFPELREYMVYKGLLKE